MKTIEFPTKKRSAAEQRLRQAERISRVLNLIELCRDGNTIPELQERLRCSRRTIYRDLDAIELAGMNVERETDGLFKFCTIRISKGTNENSNHGLQ